MPTGYTYPIIQEKNYTFEQYVMNCARQFGACISLRDDPNTEIPEKFEEKSYHKKEYEEALEELEELEKMGLKKIEKKLQVEFRKKENCYNENKKITAIKIEKYTVMLKKVVEWNPPSNEHIELKDFMINQIETSIKQDSYESDKPEKESAEDWLNCRINSAKRNIKYHMESWKADTDRIKSQNKWIKDLRDSI